MYSIVEESYSTSLMVCVWIRRPWDDGVIKMKNRVKQTGFTLVEVLIVVVILGILASIVIPQFSSASEEARANSVAKLLQSMRGQIEVYRVEHNNDYPTLDQMWDNMMNKTDAEGNIAVDGEYGPYFKMLPRNQYTQSTTVVAVGEGSATDGWEYDPESGRVTAVGFDETTRTYTAPGGEEPEE